VYRRDNNEAPLVVDNRTFRHRGCWLTAPRRDLNLATETSSPREMAMKWKTPKIIEIAVGLEINAYACAEVK
jgi:coenzyme PQQ precursor peptide PqqA